MHTLNHAHKIKDEQSAMDITPVVDYKVTMLIAAGAAMAANCEPCLNKIVPDLIEAGVAEADIQKAVEIGQFVKDKPAAIMKEAADALAGTRLSEQHKSEGCPSGDMKAASGCCG
jgi:alkylhydroperoxidase/carboxymuconolactone decarboxylase family protein YurZ